MNNVTNGQKPDNVIVYLPKVDNSMVSQTCVTVHGLVRDVRVVSKVCQIGRDFFRPEFNTLWLNGTNKELCHIRFQYILAQCDKFGEFIPIGAHLTHFGVKSDIRGSDAQRDASLKQMKRDCVKAGLC